MAKRNAKPTHVEVEPMGEGMLLPVRLPAKQEYGIQGFRRGDAVFYTVRGEPDEVSKLMQELKKWGVPEVIALVRHRAGPRRQDAEDEEQDAEATESDENDKKKA